MSMRGFFFFCWSEDSGDVFIGNGIREEGIEL